MERKTQCQLPAHGHAWTSSVLFLCWSPEHQHVCGGLSNKINFSLLQCLFFPAPKVLSFSLLGKS